MQPRVYPPNFRRKKGFDLSVLVVGVVMIFVVWGIVQTVHMLKNAERGLLRFEAVQRDLFIDPALVEAARHVAAKPALVSGLRLQTVMVFGRINAGHSAVGTGVVVRNDARGMVILTARHVVRHGGPVSVILPLDERVTVPVTHMVYSPRLDLALVFVSKYDSRLRAARFAKRDLDTRQSFVVMGHPGRRSWAATAGLAERHLRYTFLFCPQCEKGDSGAGVYTTDGSLTGIIVSKVIVDAPNLRTGKRMHVIAFFMEPLAETQAFVRYALSR